MRLALRPLTVLPVLALALGLSWLALAPNSAATTPTVMIYDNDAPSAAQRFDPGQGWWGFAPQHLEVKRGEGVLFQSPPANHYSHTVTSIVREGNSSYTTQLIAGSRFDSTPNADARIQPGNNWTLDTAGLDPGHYAYYCRFHLWMLASVTVTQ